ncbi:MAG: PAS domain-containing protein [Labilithrix sp.]|nr:PAS domain-containing protein [Labilithrix sp.]MCW5810839.1 PAS domain-containing protein [Labilithrix sp.]
MSVKLRLRLFLLVWAVIAASVYWASRAPASALGIGFVAAAIVTVVSVRWFDETVRPITTAHEQLAGNFSRAAYELAGERDLVRRILDGMQEGVLLLDKDGRVALMNPSLREMLLLQADVIGKPLLEVVRHAELKEILDRARTTKKRSEGEVEVGGLKPRHLLVRATAFTGSMGALAKTRSEDGALLAVFFDVTDVRRLESLRRDFVANVSHELRTPVTAVLSAAETLDLALDKDPEGARRFLGIIERNASRLQGLIEDLLDLSRIESRELRLRPERFGFESFAAHLVGLFRERADKKRITLRLDCPRALEIDCDRRALEQVLTNLVDNAVKYCPEGCAISLHAERTEKATLIRVVDDGPGIAAQHIARLFERFYRVDAGRSREMGGTGLGLSICKHLVEAMGGSIDVKSAVGKGTTFEVRVPESPVKLRASSKDVAA